MCVLSVTGTAATVTGLPDLRRSSWFYQTWDSGVTKPSPSGSNRINSRGRAGDRWTNMEDRDSSPGSISLSVENMTGSAVSLTDDISLSSRDVLKPKSESNKHITSNSFRSNQENRKQKNDSKSQKRNETGCAPTSNSFRVRLAKPCSYCHVPYHHRLAPFTNMKLGKSLFFLPSF